MKGSQIIISFHHLSDNQTAREYFITKLESIKHNIALHKDASATCYRTCDKNCSRLNHGKRPHGTWMNDSLNVDCELLHIGECSR